MYSYNNINIAYSFGELKSILLYEKWNIIQKKSVYTLMLINKKKTNNYLPNEIMRLIVSYIKVDDNTDKVWINKNEAYQKYNKDIIFFEFEMDKIVKKNIDYDQIFHLAAWTRAGKFCEWWPTHRGCEAAMNCRLRELRRRG